MCAMEDSEPAHEASNSFQEWVRLLQLGNDELTLDQTIDLGTEHESYGVIELDVQRTRGADAFFQSPDTQQVMMHVLTKFCSNTNDNSSASNRRVQYMQGLSEVLAPFLKLASICNQPIHASAMLFDRFVHSSMPLIFHPDGVLTLQCLYAMNDLLIKYHDPELASFLEECGMASYIYVNSWFVTYFARQSSIETILELWKHVVAFNRPVISMFLGTAYLHSQRELLMSTQPDLVPAVLTKMKLSSPSDAAALFETATKLMHCTPSLMQEWITRACFTAALERDERQRLLHTMQRSPCAIIGVQEVANMVMSGDCSENRDHLMLLDCRPAHEFQASRLIGAANVHEAELLQLKLSMEAHLRVKDKRANERLSPTACLLSSCKDTANVRYVVFGSQSLHDWNSEQDLEDCEHDAVVAATLLTELGFMKVCLLEDSYSSLLLALEELGANIHVSAVRVPVDPLISQAASASSAQKENQEPRRPFSHREARFNKSEMLFDSYHGSGAQTPDTDAELHQRRSPHLLVRLRTFFIGSTEEHDLQQQGQQPLKKRASERLNTSPSKHRVRFYSSALNHLHFHHHRHAQRQHATDLGVAEDRRQHSFSQRWRRNQAIAGGESTAQTSSHKAKDMCATARTLSDLTICSESSVTADSSPAVSPH